MSDSALGGLKSMLEGGQDEYDWMPTGLRDQEARDQLERQIEHLDPASASDAAEAIAAVERMREQGNFEPGTGKRMKDLRQGSWVPGKDQPTSSGARLIPSEKHKPVAATDRRRMASDVAPAPAKQV